MIRSVAYLAVLAASSGQGMASELPPSGLQASLHETIYEPLGVSAATAKIMRLRYVADAIANRQDVVFDDIEADFAWFCERDGAAVAAKSAPMVEQIIVSISSEIMEFGESAPNVVQYFDAFQLEGTRCIWEGL